MIITTAITTITTQLLPQPANAQGKSSLMTGQLTAASNGKPFGGTTNWKLVVTNRMLNDSKSTTK
jgi:hypothetical protein